MIFKACLPVRPALPVGLPQTREQDAEGCLSVGRNQMFNHGWTRMDTDQNPKIALWQVCIVGDSSAVPKPGRQRYGLWTPLPARARLSPTFASTYLSHCKQGA